MSSILEFFAVSDGSDDQIFAGEVVVRLSPMPPLFTDGFESGTTEAWN